MPSMLSLAVVAVVAGCAAARSFEEEDVQVPSLYADPCECESCLFCFARPSATPLRGCAHQNCICHTQKLHLPHSLLCLTRR
jgi:hypothetical protein